MKVKWVIIEGHIKQALTHKNKQDMWAQIAKKEGEDKTAYEGRGAKEHDLLKELKEVIEVSIEEGTGYGALAGRGGMR